MNNSRRILALLALSLILSRPSQAQNLPPSVSSPFEKRESTSHSLRFEWTMREGVTVIPIDRKFISPERIPVRSGGKIRSAQESQELENLIKGDELRNEATLIVERNPNLTHAYLTGYAGTPKRTSHFEEYYGDGYGVMFRYDEEPPLPGSSALFVWKTPGGALYDRGPFQEGLDISPEEYVVVSNNMALALHGCHWRLLSSSPMDFVVASDVEKGNFAPYSIEMTVDRNHGNAVSRIETKSPRSNTRCDVSYSRLFDHQWIGYRMEMDESVRSILSRQRVYTLQKIASSGRVQLDFPRGSVVNDYRRHGANMTTRDFMKTGRNSDTKSLFYAWSGRLPDQTQIRRNVPPAPQKEAVHDKLWILYTLGGACLVVGGLVYLRAKK